MRLPISLILLFFATVCPCLAQNPKPVADRLTAQSSLFDEYYESELRNFPERATAFGDYRYNDQLADYSLAAIVQRDKSNREFLARLQAIPTSGFSSRTSSRTICLFASCGNASRTTISRNMRCLSTS